MKKFQFTSSQSEIVEGVRTQTMGQIWVVGGAIRDLLLKRTPKDIDFATDLEPKNVQSLLRQLGMIVIPDQTALDHGITRTVDKETGEIIDIATLRKDEQCDGRHARVVFTKSLREDLARRDLTINAMAAVVDVDGTIDQLHDPFEGLRDIENKVINFVGDPNRRVKEDWLRMVRACRFCALGPEWERSRDTNHAMWAYKDRINEVSAERIRDELLKAMSYPYPGGFIRALDNVDLLKYVLPPVHLGIGVDQNEYHAEDVYEHCLGALDAAASLTDKPLLRLATLLHDVGKPITRSVDKAKRVHFYRHEVVGADIVYNYLSDMKFSKKEMDYVSKLVRFHQWRFEKDSKDKTIRKWLQDTGKDVWEDLILLRCADRKGNLAKQHKPMVTRHMQDLIRRVKKIIDENQALFREDLAIDGNDLKELGIKPGPLFKEIFSNMLGIVVTDPSRNNRDWLIGFVKKNYIKEENNGGIQFTKNNSSDV